MAVTINDFLGVSQKTDSHTLTIDDAWQTVEISKATAVTLTVPPNSSVAFPVNTRIFLKRAGVGVMTVAAGVGVTITGSSGALTDAGLNVEMTLRKTGTNTWDLQNGAANGWTDCSSSIDPTGFSAIATESAYYKDDGNMVQMWFVISGTSNNAAFTFSLPVAPHANYGVSGIVYPFTIQNNGVSAVGRLVASGSSTTATVEATITGGTFTASGTKAIRGFIMYQK